MPGFQRGNEPRFAALPGQKLLHSGGSGLQPPVGRQDPPRAGGQGKRWGGAGVGPKCSQQVRRLPWQ